MRLKIVHELLTVPALHLKDKMEKNSLLDALGSMRRTVRQTPELLRAMTQHLIQPGGQGEDKRKVAVYITDGESGDLENTLREAQEARLLHDIHLYGIGIGDEVNPTELQGIVGCLIEEHLFQVSSHSKLKKLIKTMAMELCLGKSMETSR